MIGLDIYAWRSKEVNDTDVVLDLELCMCKEQHVGDRSDDRGAEIWG